MGKSKSNSLRLSSRQKASFVILSALLMLSFVHSVSASEIPRGLDLVILVDESASLTSSDVRDEVQAVASLVARRELSGIDLAVRIAIAGFGSGDNAVDEKCPLQLVTTDNVVDFVRCADQVSRRSSSGQHTDFAKAFEYASSVFNSKGEPLAGRAVILLTDGKYDPFGKLNSAGLTAADKSALESATTSLREDGAQIWPLGFGQVSEDELNNLAKNGAPSKCEAGRQPYAIIAQGASLKTHLLEIINAITCGGTEDPKPIPYNFDVHPLVSEVTLTVRLTSVEPSVKVVASGKELCQGAWKEANDDSLSCVVAVSGADTGMWLITITESELVKKPTVETSIKGRIDLRFDKCDKSGAVVNVTRIDKNSINWVTDGKPEFPNAEFSAPSLDLQLGLTRLSGDQVSVEWENIPDAGSEVFVNLAAGQDDFVWLTASEDNCVIEPVVGSSTTVVVSSSTVVGSGDDNGDDDGDGPPWVWIVLLIVLAAVVGWLLKKRSDRGKFPVGAEFRQRNVSQNPAAKWNTRADIGGLKKASFVVDQNGWLVASDSDGAELILQRVRKRSVGDFSVTQPPQAGAGIGSTAGTESFYTFSIQGELGSGILYKGTYVTVEVPAEIEDESYLDEE